MANEQATCDLCGSTRLRHARSRNFVHRWVRAWSSWDRYACGVCGHRGWRRGKMLRHAEPVAPAPTTGHRPTERRDLRVRRRLQVRMVVMMGIGLALGILTAWLALRFASMLQAPPPE